MTLLESVVYNLTKSSIKDSLSTSNYVPNFLDAYDSAKNVFDSSVTVGSIPKIKNYSSYVIASEFNGIINQITDNLKSIGPVYKDLIKEYILNINFQRDIIIKFNRYLEQKNETISDILERSCITIYTKPENADNNETTCSFIGGYATLPYRLSDVSIYSDYASLSASTISTVNYDNTSTVISLPITTKPSLKLSDTVNDISVNYSLGITKTTVNGFYIKFFNNVKDITVTMTDLNSNIVTTFSSNNNKECFGTFNPVSISNIYIKVNLINNNIDAPISLVIDDIKVFSKITFNSIGTFVSKPKDITYTKLATTGILNFKDSSTSDQTRISSSVSISEDIKNKSFLEVLNGEQISLFSYRPKNMYDDIGVTDTFSIDGKMFYRISVQNNFKAIDPTMTKVFTGINNFYLDNSNRNKQFENWQEVISENVWKTKLINYTPNVTVNSSNYEFILNGKIVSGIVEIPIGISEIKVYKKYMPNPFNSTVDPSTLSIIRNGDIPYPYNFLYLFAGLPLFNSGFPDQVKNKMFSVTGTMTIYIGQQFLTAGLIVFDGVEEYKLFPGQGTAYPGSYIVDTRAGTILISPRENRQQVWITYYKADPNVPQAGVLFKEVLSYKYFSDMLNNKTSTSYFSIDGSGADSYLYIPLKSSSDIRSVKIIYDNIGESLYLTVKAKLSTKNNYITPAINNFNLFVK